MHPGSGMLRETKARMADTGVRVLDVEIIKLNNAEDPAAYLPVFEAAAELGVRNVLTTSELANDDLNAARLAALCEAAAPFGLHFHVEFMPWARGVTTLEQAERIVRRSAALNAHIMVDAIHFARTGATLEALRSLPPERFDYVQLCDAPARQPSTDEGILEQGRYERLFPGEGGLDLRGLLDALPQALPISLEAPKRKLGREIGFEALAGRGNEALRRFLAAAVGRPQSRQQEA